MTALPGRAGSSTRLGAEAQHRAGPQASRRRLLEQAEAVLRDYGFEPYRGPGGEIRLRNCPFDALTKDYRALVCGMNLSLMEGLVTGLDVLGVEAALDPQPGQCCVAFRSGRKGRARHAGRR